MPSLTPLSRSDEVVDSAMNEGYASGLFVLIPSAGALYWAMQKPGFVKVTNWQSRTAMVIMPALFAFGFASEQKLIHRMDEVAKETEHSRAMVNWAEKQRSMQMSKAAEDSRQVDMEILDLYRQSVEKSGVTIIPGDTLSAHHRVANYIADNPIKTLACVAAPAVGLIFYGRTGKQHLSLSMKLMHTRVFGQFATLSLLLGVMGFKEFMDRNGKFITEAEAEAKVEEMNQVRKSLEHNLQLKKQEELQFKQSLREAHIQDLQEGNAHHLK